MEKKTPTNQSSMVTNEQTTQSSMVINEQPVLHESEKYYSRFQPYEEISKEEFDRRRYPWTE